MRNLVMVGLVLMTGCGRVLVKTQEAANEVKVIEQNLESIKLLSGYCGTQMSESIKQLEASLKRIKAIVQ